MSEVSSEAMEAAARAVTAFLDEIDRVNASIPGREQYGDEVYGLNDHMLRRSDLRKVLAAAHQPARVVPSAEEVARVLRDGIADGLTDYDADADPPLFASAVARRTTPAVLALFARTETKGGE